MGTGGAFRRSREKSRARETLDLLRTWRQYGRSTDTHTTGAECAGPCADARSPGTGPGSFDAGVAAEGAKADKPVRTLSPGPGRDAGALTALSDV